MAIEEILRITDQGSPALGSVSAASARAAADLADAQAAAKDAGDAFGKVGSNAAKSAGLLGALSPAAGGAATALNDLADAGEVAMEAAAALGISGAVLGAALLAVGAVVAPLAGYFTILAREEEEAATRAKFLTEHAHDLDGALRGLEDAVLAAAVATGKLSEAQAEQQRIQDRASRSAADFATAQETTRQAAEDSYFAAAGTKQWTENLLQLSPGLAAGVDALMGWSSAQEEASFTLGELDHAAARHQDIVLETAAAEAVVAAATDKGAAATGRAASADKDAAKAAKDRAAALDDQAAMLRSHVADLDAARLDAAAQANAIHEAEWAAINAEIEATQALAQARRDAADARLADAGSAVSTAAGGPQAVLSAVASAGPWGALIAGIIDLVSNLDETMASFSDFHVQFWDSLSSFPEQLSDHLSETLTSSTEAMISAIPELIGSLAEAIPDIISTIAEFIPELLGMVFEQFVVNIPMMIIELIGALSDPRTWIKAALAFIEGIGTAIADIASGIFGGSGQAGKDVAGWADQAQKDVDTWRPESSGRSSRDGVSGSYDTGTTYVPTTGLYQLHRGEEVINPTGMGTERQEAVRGRAARVSIGGGGGRLRGTVEFEIDENAFASTLGGMRRRGFAV